MNNSGPRYKRSKVERDLNVDVVACVIILFVLCFLGGVGKYLFLPSNITLLIILTLFNVIKQILEHNYSMNIGCKTYLLEIFLAILHVCLSPLNQFTGREIVYSENIYTIFLTFFSPMLQILYLL